MKLLTRLVAICISLFASAHASNLFRQTFPSEALGRDYAYMIYLPDDYVEERAGRYPVAYLLHGSLSDETQFASNVEIKRIFDTLIEEKRIPPSIVIMPGSLSWWVDGANEPAETAFFEELLPFVENRWPIRRDRAGRIVGGLSAGGYGAVNFALKHPDKFAAAIPLSPASYEDLPPEFSTAWRHPAFVDEQGEFDEALWRSLNYPAFIDDYMKGENVVPMYIVSGDHDGLDIAYHSAVLFQRLREHQPDAVEFRVIDGGHDWPVWVATLPDGLQYAFRFVGVAE